MMTIAHRVVLALCSAAVVAALATSTVFAQYPPSSKPGEQRAKAPTPVQGELLSVDTDKKIITVKTTEGTEMDFAYTDKTEVSGGQKGVAGLAAAKNARVTVHYTEDAQTKANVATRIIVEAKPKG
jgi:hypothetical protein